MVLVEKWPFFELFFSGNIGKENIVNDILERKKTFLGYNNKEFKKSKNWHFSKGINPWFWSKNGHFSNFFFRQYRPGKCLLRYSRTKKHLFLGYKNKKFKKFKNWHFSKGLSRAFGPKMAIFPPFFLGYIGQENVFYDILEPKKSFLGYKNTKLKKSKNWHFSKGVNPWFWSKNGHFSNFFF